jgi:hypothetical protein
MSHNINMPAKINVSNLKFILNILIFIHHFYLYFETDEYLICEDK